MGSTLATRLRRGFALKLHGVVLEGIAVLYHHRLVLQTSRSHLARLDDIIKKGEKKRKRKENIKYSTKLPECGSV